MVSSQTRSAILLGILTINCNSEQKIEELRSEQLSAELNKARWDREVETITSQWYETHTEAPAPGTAAHDTFYSRLMPPFDSARAAQARLDIINREINRFMKQ